jgi:MarR family transcriptional regulator, organic hydroperoxide resistance regulator
MPAKKSPGSLNSLIIQLCRAHRARAGELLAEFDLHPGQERVLFLLWEADGLALSQLADRLGVQAPTVTKMIARMEASGYLERRPAPKDSRVTLVFLTGQGRGVKKAVEKAYAQLERETVEGLSVEERGMLLELLVKVVPNLCPSLVGEE